MIRSWNGYNNVGLCSAALAGVLEQRGSLPIVKAILVMPLVMHDSTLAFLSKASIRRRDAAALTSARPDLFANFADRFDDSLVLSLNAIQLLIHLGYAKLDTELVSVKSMRINDDFGKRAMRIGKATSNISILLDDSAEELYSNFRVRL